MSIAEDVETLGRSTPGAHWSVDEDGDPEPYLDGTVGDVLVRPEDDGRYSVQVWGPPSMLERRLTAPGLGLLLRCVASGVGGELPCSDCEERGGRYKWAKGSWSSTHANGIDGSEFLRGQGWTWNAEAWVGTTGGRVFKPIVRPCPTCSEPGPEVECGACDGPCPDCAEPGNADCARCDGTADLGCAECSDGTRATGKRRPGVPTGRETVGLAAAWLRGRPTECPACSDLRGAATTGKAGPGGWRCSECDENGQMAGDPSTREALAVLADKRQIEGDPLGELLALDLAGAACGRCWGAGSMYLLEDAQTGKPAFPCHACEGHGTALARRLRQLAVKRITHENTHTANPIQTRQESTGPT